MDKSAKLISKVFLIFKLLKRYFLNQVAIFSKLW